jgi:hypothetical protein
MSQVKAWALTRDPGYFPTRCNRKSGMPETRPKNTRDAFISAANEKARSMNAEPSHSEQMTYTEWLATLGKAQEPPEAQEYAEPFEEPEYSVSEIMVWWHVNCR